MAELSRFALREEAVLKSDLRTDRAVATAGLTHFGGVLARETVGFGFALRTLRTKAVAFLTVETFRLLAAASFLVGQVEAARCSVAALSFGRTARCASDSFACASAEVPTADLVRLTATVGHLLAVAVGEAAVTLFAGFADLVSAEGRGTL